MFDKKDILFFNTILSFEKIIEKSHEKTFDIEFNFDSELIKKGLAEVTVKNKKEIKKFFHIGNYDDDKEVFTWNEQTRGLMNSIIPKDKKKKETFLHGFSSTYEKLCSKPEINIENKYKNIIPYMQVILLHPFNLFRASTKENPKFTSYFAIELNLNKALGVDFMDKLSSVSQISNSFSRTVKKDKKEKKSSKKPSKKPTVNKKRKKLN